MVALIALIVVVVALLLAAWGLRRRSADDVHSVEGYRQALDTLQDMRRGALTNGRFIPSADLEQESPAQEPGAHTSSTSPPGALARRDRTSGVVRPVWPAGTAENASAPDSPSNEAPAARLDPAKLEAARVEAARVEAARVAAARVEAARIDVARVDAARIDSQSPEPALDPSKLDSTAVETTALGGDATDAGTLAASGAGELSGGGSVPSTVPPVPNEPAGFETSIGLGEPDLTDADGPFVRLIGDEESRGSGRTIKTVEPNGAPGTPSAPSHAGLGQQAASEPFVPSGTTYEPASPIGPGEPLVPEASEGAADPSSNGSPRLVFDDTRPAGSGASRSVAGDKQEIAPRTERAVVRMNHRPRRHLVPIAAVVVAVAAIAAVVAYAATSSPNSSRHHTATGPATSAGTGATHSSTTAHSGGKKAPPSTTTTAPQGLMPSSGSTAQATYVVPTSSYGITLAASGGASWVQVTDTASRSILFTGVVSSGSTQTVQASGATSLDIGAPHELSVAAAQLPVGYPAGFQTPFTMTFQPR